MMKRAMGKQHDINLGALELDHASRAPQLITMCIHTHTHTCTPY